MQHQKQNVLARTQRKQMRAQRHLARKIKSSLRRSRQRSRKLPFAHPTYRKPNARRFNSQNLLPRNPKPLREDRAQPLVPPTHIPNPTFHRPSSQQASTPLAHGGGRAPRRPPRPSQKPPPTSPIPQRPPARTPNRPPRRTRSSRLPQPLNQPRYRRRFEQAADRYLNTKARTKAADQARRQQRMATKRKKVVVNPNTLQSQDLGKQGAQQLLPRAPRQTRYTSTNP